MAENQDQWLQSNFRLRNVDAYVTLANLLEYTIRLLREHARYPWKYVFIYSGTESEGSNTETQTLDYVWRADRAVNVAIMADASLLKKGITIQRTFMLSAFEVEL